MSADEKAVPNSTVERRTVCIFSIAGVVCLHGMPVLHQEPQSSEEDLGETLKRTLKAQRRRRMKRVRLPPVPSFFLLLQLIHSAPSNMLNILFLRICSISWHIQGA